jgi:hypothetical protein
MCDSAGTFTFSRDVEIETKDEFNRGHGRVIAAGTTAVCPHCNGEKVDLDFVGWHCLSGDVAANCRTLKNMENGHSEVHAACGYRVMLPLAEDQP